MMKKPKSQPQSASDREMHDSRATEGSGNIWLGTDHGTWIGPRCPVHHDSHWMRFNESWACVACVEAALNARDVEIAALKQERESLYNHKERMFWWKNQAEEFGRMIRGQKAEIERLTTELATTRSEGMKAAEGRIAEIKELRAKACDAMTPLGCQHPSQANVQKMMKENERLMKFEAFLKKHGRTSVSEQCPACKKNTTFEDDDVYDGDEIECENCGATLMISISVEYYLCAVEKDDKDDK